VKLPAIELVQMIFRAKCLLKHATLRATHLALLKHRSAIANATADSTHVLEVFSAVRPLIDRMRSGLAGPFETFWLEPPARSTGGLEETRSLGGKAGFLLREFEASRSTDPSAARETLAAMHGPGVCPGAAQGMWSSYVSDHPLTVPLNLVDSGPASKVRSRFENQSELPDALVRAEDPVVDCRAFLGPDGEWRLHSSAEYPRTHCAWNGWVLSRAVADLGDRSTDRWRGCGWQRRLEEWPSTLVEVSAVAEMAFKTRTVTKGTSAGATVVNVWQGQVFDQMKLTGLFPSLGGRVDGSHVSGLWQHGLSVDGPAGWADEMFFASRDFTSATDLLSHDLSHLILGCLVGGFVAPDVVLDDNDDKILRYPPMPEFSATEPTTAELRRHGGSCWRLEDGRWMFENRKSRAKVMLEFRTLDGRLVKARVGTVRLTVEKSLGQLMGQGTSFPLLCLVNAAITIAAYRRHGIGLADARRLFMVNGDDALAVSTPAIEATFWEIASSLGLKRSPGKSHVSRSFCSFNSQDYYRQGSTWVRAQSVRSHLLFGFKKLQGDYFAPSQVVGALFETVPYRWQDSFIALFLSKHGKKLTRECGGRNLFVPVAWGGLGQEPPAKWKWHVTENQVAIAERLLAANAFVTPAFGPVRPIPPAPAPKSAPWNQVEAVSWYREQQDKSLDEFSKKYSLKDVHSLMEARYVACRCGLEVPGAKHGSRCDCGKPVILCTFAEKKSPPGRCCYCGTAPWGDIDDCLGTGLRCVMAVPDPLDWCACHGYNSTRGVRSRKFAISAEEVRALSRGAAQYERQRPTISGWLRPPACKTWQEKKLAVADPVAMPWKIPLPDGL